MCLVAGASHADMLQPLRAATCTYNIPGSHRLLSQNTFHHSSGSFSCLLQIQQSRCHEFWGQIALITTQGVSRRHKASQNMHLPMLSPALRHIVHQHIVYLNRKQPLCMYAYCKSIPVTKLLSLDHGGGPFRPSASVYNCCTRIHTEVSTCGT